jgi:hypothetical protein
MDTTMDRFDDDPVFSTHALVELGTVTRATRGFLLGFFFDAGLGRRLLPI